ncbi:unnamed protein product [Amoebophrya sp. A120]|nr:unnamed protein product [Amoebophrya sp. A120]|eukprot:GSA120T00012199001.1
MTMILRQTQRLGRSFADEEHSGGGNQQQAEHQQNEKQRLQKHSHSRIAFASSTCSLQQYRRARRPRGKMRRQLTVVSTALLQLLLLVCDYRLFNILNSSEDHYVKTLYSVRHGMLLNEILTTTQNNISVVSLFTRNEETNTVSTSRASTIAVNAITLSSSTSANPAAVDSATVVNTDDNIRNAIGLDEPPAGVADEVTLPVPEQKSSEIGVVRDGVYNLGDEQQQERNQNQILPRAAEDESTASLSSTGSRDLADKDPENDLRTSTKTLRLDLVEKNNLLDLGGNIKSENWFDERDKKLEKKNQEELKRRTRKRGKNDLWDVKFSEVEKKVLAGAFADAEAEERMGNENANTAGGRKTNSNTASTSRSENSLSLSTSESALSQPNVATQNAVAHTNEMYTHELRGYTIKRTGTGSGLDNAAMVRAQLYYSQTFGCQGQQEFAIEKGTFDGVSDLCGCQCPAGVTGTVCPCGTVRDCAWLCENSENCNAFITLGSADQSPAKHANTTKLRSTGGSNTTTYPIPEDINVGGCVLLRYEDHTDEFDFQQMLQVHQLGGYPKICDPYDKPGEWACLFKLYSVETYHDALYNQRCGKHGSAPIVTPGQCDIAGLRMKLFTGKNDVTNLADDIHLNMTMVYAEDYLEFCSVLGDKDAPPEESHMIFNPHFKWPGSNVFSTNFGSRLVCYDNDYQIEFLVVLCNTNFLHMYKMHRNEFHQLRRRNVSRWC